MENATKVRSNLNMGTLLFSVESSEPEVVDSAPAVVGSLADGTDHLTEVGGVQLYESIIDVIVQSTSVAFRNFYHSWNSVLMDQPDLHLSFVVIFIQTVGDSENI